MLKEKIKNLEESLDITTKRYQEAIREFEELKVEKEMQNANLKRKLKEKDIVLKK